MAKLYLYQAVYIVTRKESIISFAEGRWTTHDANGLRRFTKYTNMPNVCASRTITTKLVAENDYCFLINVKYLI
jgi:hypothetical protein